MTKFYNIDTSITLGGGNASDTVVSSQKSIKTYVDNNIPPELSSLIGNGSKILAVKSDETGVEWIINEERLQGLQGIQGRQGATGSQGTSGLSGDTGRQGIQGITGTQGDTGLQGTCGFQGTMGAQGIAGEQGDMGIQGSYGIQGPYGAQGTVGSQGVKGIQGFYGIQGTRGVRGLQGLNGRQGVQGIYGLQGTKGNQGTQGSIGGQGVQGLNGGGLMDHDFTHTSNSTVSTSVSVAYAANSRGSRMVTTSADLNVSFVVNNRSDNYLWVRNTSSSDIDVTISSVTYNNSSVSNVYVPFDGITIPSGCVGEIGVVVNTDGAFITSRNDLKL